MNMEGIWHWNLSGQGRDVGERFWRQVLRTHCDEFVRSEDRAVQAPREIIR